jgi:hypothetical protein
LPLFAAVAALLGAGAAAFMTWREFTKEAVEFTERAANAILALLKAK